MKRFAAILIAALAISSSAAAQEQQQQAPADAPRVFLDCSYYCDMDFIRTEIRRWAAVVEAAGATAD